MTNRKHLTRRERLAVAHAALRGLLAGVASGALRWILENYTS